MSKMGEYVLDMQTFNTECAYTKDERAAVLLAVAMFQFDVDAYKALVSRRPSMFKGLTFEQFLDLKTKYVGV